MIGFGIHTDVTVAAEKAIQDAMDRSCNWESFDIQQHYTLYIQLAVPSLPSTTSSSTITNHKSSPNNRHGNDDDSIDDNEKKHNAVDVNYLLRLLSTQLSRLQLIPTIHIQEGGMHVPSLRDGAVGEYVTKPNWLLLRSETNVVIACLTLLPKKPASSYESSDAAGTISCTMKKHQFSTELFNEQVQPLQPDEIIPTETTTRVNRGPPLHGFLTTTVPYGDNNSNLKLNTLSSTNLNVSVSNYLANSPSNKISAQQTTAPNRNSLTSIDMLANISAAIMDEQREDNGRNHKNQNGEKSTHHCDKVETSKILKSIKHDSRTDTSLPYISHAVVSVNKKMPPGKTPKNNLRHYVRHTYQDYSDEVPPIQTDEDGRTILQQISVSKDATAGISNAPFPLKLHETLTRIENDKFDNIIGWLPHGRSFKIRQQEEFVNTILPEYFIMNKKSSFLRQLNLYGFRRISDGSYYHAKFLRGMEFLCHTIQRQKVNGNGIRAAGNPNEEPIFSQYPICPPPHIAKMQSNQQTSYSTQVADPRDEPQPTLLYPSNTKPYELPYKNQNLLCIRDSSSSTSGEDAVNVTRIRTSTSMDSSVDASDRNHDDDDDDDTLDSSPSRYQENSYQRLVQIPKASLSFTASSNETSNSRQRPPTFPLQLQLILDRNEREGKNDVLSWLPHGRAFMVHDIDRFVAEILPIYFNQTKYSSFQRQCHMYQMTRITNGPDKGSYHHAYLQRGRPDLSVQIFRVRVNGHGTRRPNNPDLEPNLYTLPPLPPIIASNVH